MVWHGGQEGSAAEGVKVADSGNERQNETE